MSGNVSFGGAGGDDDRFLDDNLTISNRNRGVKRPISSGVMERALKKARFKKFQPGLERARRAVKTREAREAREASQRSLLKTRNDARKAAKKREVRKRLIMEKANKESMMETKRLKKQQEIERSRLANLKRAEAEERRIITVLRAKEKVLLQSIKRDTMEVRSARKYIKELETVKTLKVHILDLEETVARLEREKGLHRAGTPARRKVDDTIKKKRSLIVEEKRQMSALDEDKIVKRLEETLDVMESIGEQGVIIAAVSAVVGLFVSAVAIGATVVKAAADQATSNYRERTKVNPFDEFKAKRDKEEQDKAAKKAAKKAASTPLSEHEHVELNPTQPTQPTKPTQFSAAELSIMRSPKYWSSVPAKPVSGRTMLDIQKRLAWMKSLIKTYTAQPGTTVSEKKETAETIAEIRKRVTVWKKRETELGSAQPAKPVQPVKPTQPVPPNGYTLTEIQKHLTREKSFLDFFNRHPGMFASEKKETIETIALWNKRKAKQERNNPTNILPPPPKNAPKNAPKNSPNTSPISSPDFTQSPSQLYLAMLKLREYNSDKFLTNRGLPGQPGPLTEAYKDKKRLEALIAKASKEERDVAYDRITKMHAYYSALRTRKQSEVDDMTAHIARNRKKGIEDHVLARQLAEVRRSMASLAGEAAKLPPVERPTAKTDPPGTFDATPDPAEHEHVELTNPAEHEHVELTNPAEHEHVELSHTSSTSNTSNMGKTVIGDSSSIHPHILKEWGLEHRYISSIYSMVSNNPLQFLLPTISDQTRFFVGRNSKFEEWWEDERLKFNEMAAHSRTGVTHLLPHRSSQMRTFALNSLVDRDRLSQIRNQINNGLPSKRI